MPVDFNTTLPKDYSEKIALVQSHIVELLEAHGFLGVILLTPKAIDEANGIDTIVFRTPKCDDTCAHPQQCDVAVFTGSAQYLADMVHQIIAGTAVEHVLKVPPPQ